jgi:hypothetical protein
VGEDRSLLDLDVGAGRPEPLRVDQLLVAEWINNWWPGTAGQGPQRLTVIHCHFLPNTANIIGRLSPTLIYIPVIEGESPNFVRFIYDSSAGTIK